MSDDFPIRTRAPCPVCRQEVEAHIVARRGDAYLQTRCAEHGEREALFWRDASLFLALFRQRTPGVLPAGPLDLARGDAAGFVTTYAMDVTLRCNMACPTCVSAAGRDAPPDAPFDELVARVPDHRSDRFPPNLALVGGESTLREDLPELIAAIKAKGVEPRLNSNGLRLLDESLLGRLRQAGLRWVILQFDGLSAGPSLVFRGQDVAALKLAVIDKLGAHGFLVHLAVMVDKGVNDHELGDILYFAARTPHIRRVSLYPRSHIGRIDDPAHAGTHVTDLLEALAVTTQGQITRRDILAASALGRRLFTRTGHPMFRRRACIAPFVVVHDRGRLIPANRLLAPLGPLRYPRAFRIFTAAARRSRQVDEGAWGPHVLFCNIEKFYEAHALDLIGARQCHHVYLTADGAHPFCLYNNLLRHGGCQ